jgi:hypothetical protein
MFSSFFPLGVAACVGLAAIVVLVVVGWWAVYSRQSRRRSRPASPEDDPEEIRRIKLRLLAGANYAPRRPSRTEKDRPDHKKNYD